MINKTECWLEKMVKVYKKLLQYLKKEKKKQIKLNKSYEPNRTKIFWTEKFQFKKFTYFLLQ